MYLIGFCYYFNSILYTKSYFSTTNANNANANATNATNATNINNSIIQNYIIHYPITHSELKKEEEKKGGGYIDIGLHSVMRMFSAINLVSFLQIILIFSK